MKPRIGRRGKSPPTAVLEAWAAWRLGGAVVMGSSRRDVS